MIKHKQLIVQKQLLVLIILFTAKYCFSQSPPSPGSGSFIRHQNIPVSLYTGIPQVDVPLYNLPHPNGTTIPIYLSYHGGGIKVQDVAGPVGLGWNLQAGGSITRVVRGLPDEEGKYYDPDFDRDQTVLEIASGLTDGEHDMFYFSIPGRSGSFIVDKDGSTTHTLPYSDISIEKDGTFSAGSWSITDESGNKYYFGESDQKETTVTETFVDGSLQSQETYVSTWYLNRMEYSIGGIVEFDYFPGSNYSFSTKSASVIRTSCDGDPFMADVNLTEIVSEIQNPRYIESITTDLGSINFNWAGDRLEIGMNYLESIDVLDFQSGIISGFSLDYFYFDSSDSFERGFKYETVENCTDDVCKRLGLKSIRRIGANGAIIPFREFDYLDGQYEGADSYDIFELPPRDSEHVDHWGYFNGSNSTNIHGSGLPFIWNDNLNGTPNLTLKAANGEFAKANLLFEIKDENERITRLHYEPNINSNGDLIGGVRINSIQYINEEEELTESFVYHDGYSLDEPEYETHVVGTSCEESIISSSSVTSLFDFNGPAIGYGKVERHLPNGGIQVYEFHNYFDHPDEDASYQVNTTDYQTYPRNVPNTSRFWERGVTSAISSMDPTYTTEEEVRNTTTYYEDLSDLALIPNLQVVHRKNVTKYVTGTYHLNVRPYLTKRNIQYYHVNIPGNEQVIKMDDVEFTYHDTHLTLPTSTKEDLRDNTEIRTFFHYPSDYDLTTIAADAVPEVVGHKYLNDNHIINVPIETEIYYGVVGSLSMISGQFQTYRSYGTFVQPYKSYRLDISDPITDYARVTLATTQNAFDRDPRLRLVQSLNFNTSGRLQSESGESGITTNYTWNASNNLLEEVSVNNRSTNYNQLPLIGLQSSTDPNGNTISYEYDVFNRLRLIRDQDYDIIERYRYHYKSEDFGADADLGCHGTLETGEVITFTAENAIGSVGTNTYFWDLGNGTVVETTTPSTTHTYTVPGIYPISLTIVNPEYDPIHIPKNLNVHGSGVPTPGAPFDMDLFVTVDASPTQDLCILRNTTTPILFETAITGTACEPLNYHWERSVNGGEYEDFTGGPSSIPPLDWFSTASGANSIQITVTAIDDCENVVPATLPLNITVSDTCPEP